MLAETWRDGKRIKLTVLAVPGPGMNLGVDKPLPDDAELSARKFRPLSDRARVGFSAKVSKAADEKATRTDAQALSEIGSELEKALSVVADALRNTSLAPSVNAREQATATLALYGITSSLAGLPDDAELADVLDTILDEVGSVAAAGDEMVETWDECDRDDREGLKDNVADAVQELLTAMDRLS